MQANQVIRRVGDSVFVRPGTILFAVTLLLTGACSQKHPLVALQEVKWIHGTEDCSQHADLPIQIVRYDASTWIMRQNKCVHYEAPFLYLFVGRERALLMDTGATEDSIAFPLAGTVSKILDAWKQEHGETISLIVAHSHNHSDHVAADAQFRNKRNTTIVGLDQKAVASFFDLTDWPNRNNQLDLGGRMVTILPIPGHEEASIAVYDEQTQLLLTGDSFYPGRLYVRDWPAFAASIKRLNQFCQQNPVSWIVGNHIEMSDQAGVDYPTGSTYQPHEHSLPLTKLDLQQLNEELKSGSQTPVYKAFQNYILVPKIQTPERSIQQEALVTLTLSGYPDFLATEGEDVWVTNIDTVQKLSHKMNAPVIAARAPGICGAPVVAFGSLWAASCKENALLRLDTRTGKIIARIPSGVADPEGELRLAAGAGSIWILSDKHGILARIDPKTNKVIAEIPVNPGSFCAAFGFDAVWITNTDHNSVQRIDPATNRVIATIAVGPIPRFLAAGEGGIWTLNQGDGTVTRIDPSTNIVVATIDCQVPGPGGDVDAGGGHVWVRGKRGRMLQAVNPATNVVDRIYGPLNGSGAVRVAGNHVWVTAHDVNSVWAIAQ